MTARASRPSVVLIDDHELFRQGLSSLLNPDFDVLAVGADSRSAIDLCRSHKPDLLILDVELGADPAERTIRALRRSSPEIVIVVLTMFKDAVLQRQLLKAGASDFITKTIDHDGLVVRLRAALRAGPASSAYVPEETAGLLSQRELEVLRLLAAAASNREIANQLSISEGTVKRHAANMYAKLGAVSRIDAVAKAGRYNLLSDD